MARMISIEGLGGVVLDHCVSLFLTSVNKEVFYTKFRPT